MKTNWTTKDIPDLTGKVIVVTGANSGIGFEAAKEFARKGAQVILACRSMDKAEKALGLILGEIPDAKAEIMDLDLTSLKSIRKFADVFKGKYDRLDILLNNAGIMMVPYGKTEDGFEKQFGTNHLGHYALTGLLIDVILKTPKARIVNVSSTGHRFGDMDFDNLMFEGGNKYSPMKAYGRSKLANLLFTYESQRRLEEKGADVISVAAHPGMSDTHLADHLFNKFPFILMKPFSRFAVQSAAMGALPSIRACVDPETKGGQYYGPDGKREAKGWPILVESNEASHNEEDAKKLWEISEELTGV